jgi:iron complex outermembrane receptor protein
VADADISELDLLTVDGHEWQHQWSQELTVATQGSRVSWVGGLFLFDELDRQSVRVDQLPSATQVRLDPRVGAASRALFGETSLALTPWLSGTVGLRYTRERKDIDNAGGLYGLAPPMGPISGATYAYADSIVDTAWTPKFVVDVKLPFSAMAYLSATRGFKTGGFNLSSTQPGRGYAPEWAWNYEGGVKTTMMNGGARLNIAVFRWTIRTCRCRRRSASACSTSEMLQLPRSAASKSSRAAALVVVWKREAPRVARCHL